MPATCEWQEHEDIFHGAVPVILKSADREDRSSSLTVAITHSTGQPRNQRVLRVQLTDESDAFLLYTLEISEDDFHSLKTEQNILVDFLTFPSKVIELLRQCQSSAAEDHPRFVAVLSTQSGQPMLTITETNPFRQLAHLALRFVAGNDAAIKRYLAGRVTEYKAQLLTTSDELRERTAQLQATAERAASQAEQLRNIGDEHARELHERDVRHAGLLNASREAAVAAQQEQASASEEARQRLLDRSEAELRELRRSEAEARARVGELTSSTHELSLRQRETASRLQGAEQEVGLLRQEATGLREENARLSARVHALEKALSARDVELAAASQAASDKETLLAQMGCAREAAAESKRQLEDSLAMYKEGHSRLQEQLRLSAQEITKGNSIIAKLQGDSRELKAKLKLKAQQLLQQGELCATKQTELDVATKAMAELRAAAAELRADKDRAEERTSACKAQLTEAHTLLRSNQEVIQFLNHELNEAQAGGRPLLGSLHARPPSFRPMLPSRAPMAGMGGATSSPPSKLPVPSSYTSPYTSSTSSSSSSSLSSSSSSAAAVAAAVASHSSLPPPPPSSYMSSLTPTGAKVNTPTGSSTEAADSAGATPAAATAAAATLTKHETKPPVATRLNFDNTTHGADAEATAKMYVPGAALASLRSRAGLALAESLPSADRARIGAAGADSTGGSAFAEYLAPSSPRQTSYGGVPLGTTLGTA
jgi:spindle assembly abnormal protein 6